MKKLFGIVLMFMVSAGAFANGWHDWSKWKTLGERRVSAHNERDTVYVTAFKGRYDKIALKVENAPVRINRMTVFFANGQRQDFLLNKRFERGQRSRIFDLTGGDRYIKKVEFSYKTAWGANYRFGTVKLYGRKD